MNSCTALGFFLLFISVYYLPKASARTKTLKIIIPSKIRYVHHHHTHVVVMKDKKPHRGSDAKYHHLHFYDPSGRKGKDSNHYFIPFIPPQAEDEVDEETATNYAVTTPKRGSYSYADKYRPVSTRQLSPVYEEPEYYSSSKKYRVYSRADIPQTKYFKTDPTSSLEEDEPEEPLSKEDITDHYEYSPELNKSYDKGHKDLYRAEPLFYPGNGFYSNDQQLRATMESNQHATCLELESKLGPRPKTVLKRFPAINTVKTLDSYEHHESEPLYIIDSKSKCHLCQKSHNSSDIIYDFEFWTSSRTVDCFEKGQNDFHNRPQSLRCEWI